MARTPKTTTAPAEAPKFNETALATLNAAPVQLAAAHEAMDEVLAAGIDLGRLEALDFVLTVSTTAILSIYENVKKSKAWRHLRNPKNADGQQFESLEQFCTVKLGKSYARLRELASNSRALGQEAFEQAERLGLHQRDYNAIKALPAPDQELVRRAVEEATTREQVLDVLHELAVRTAQEKAALQEELQDANDQVESLAEDKRGLINEKEALRKQARRLAQATPDEVATHHRAGVEKLALEVAGIVNGPLREGLENLRDHAETSGIAQDAWMAGQLQQLASALRSIAGRLGVDLVDSERPAWMEDMTAPAGGTPLAN